MKKTIDLCDKCNKVVSEEKCRFCESDICTNCTSKFALRFASDGGEMPEHYSRAYNLLNQSLTTSSLFSRSKKKAKGVEFIDFQECIIPLCNSCLKKLSKLLDNEKSFKYNGVDKLVIDFYKKLKELLITNEI